MGDLEIAADYDFFFKNVLSLAFTLEGRSLKS